MARKAACKGAEYAHITGMSLKYFQVYALSEVAIHRDKEDAIWYDLH